MPDTLLLPAPGGADRLSDAKRVVVAGGGLAGVAAATVLSERGASVTLVESEAQLGGRVRAWGDTLADGTPFEMERGFHAFFRQYYNLRSLLRRIDPALSFLMPLEDYPILGPDGKWESFAGLPHKAPWNIAALVKRSETLRLRDLRHVNGRAALEMLRFDPDRTYDAFDDQSAADYLDSLSFPPPARRMLFDVFAHSFFNPEEAMSAGELLMMFHFYFVGNPEGLTFDVLRQPFSTAVWTPFARRLVQHGVTLQMSSTVERVERQGDAWRVVTDGGSQVADAVVLALPVPALQTLLANSPDLQTHAEWTAKVRSLELTRPFVVWRLWVDQPAKDGRPPFAGTTGVGLLDNISLYELLEDESRDWAQRTGGSIIELHAYAVPEEQSDDSVRKELLDGLYRLYPETRDASILEERYLRRHDCPAFHRGSHEARPGVSTPHTGIALAGDFARMPFPSALMERATSSGILAANTLLHDWGVRPEPVQTIPRRGMLARFNKRPRAKVANA